MPAAVVVLCLAVLTGCSDTEKELAPPDCITNEPTEAFLRIFLTLNAENPSVPITIYRGAYEENQSVLMEAANKTEVLYRLALNHHYTVTARYVVGADTLLVIRGTDFRTTSTEYLDATCYSIKGHEVDVRLGQ